MELHATAYDVLATCVFLTVAAALLIVVLRCKCLRAISRLPARIAIGITLGLASGQFASQCLL